MPHFDFDAEYTPPEEDEVEPFTFRFAGQDFEAMRPPVPWGAITDIMRLARFASAADDPSKLSMKVILDIATNAGQIEEFILSVLRDDDIDLSADRFASSEDRFRALRSDKAKRVDVSRLMPVIGRLVGYYTGRPTAAPSPSEPGRSSTATTSTAAGGSTGSTPDPSVPTPVGG